MEETTLPTPTPKRRYPREFIDAISPYLSQCFVELRGNKHKCIEWTNDFLKLYLENPNISVEDHLPSRMYPGVETPPDFDRNRVAKANPWYCYF